MPHAVLEGAATGELITLVPVTLAKGLEFDQVIVYEPAQIASAEARGLHRLYVALTRAVSRLTVLHAEPLPAALAGWPRDGCAYMSFSTAVIRAAESSKDSAVARRWLKNTLYRSTSSTFSTHSALVRSSR